MKVPSLFQAIFPIRLFGALVAILLPRLAVHAQSTIVYRHFPPTGTNANFFPYDALGERVIGYYPAQTTDIVINGQVAFTFHSDFEAFSVQTPSNAIAGVLLGGAAVPLRSGTEIGASAAGYTWLYRGANLTYESADTDSGSPSVPGGYFTALEAGYIGLLFQQNAQTYYGWAQAGAPLYDIFGGWVYDYAYETVPDKPILAGAVPQAAMTVPTLVSTNQLRLTWQTQIGNTYQVQFKESLAQEYPVWANLDFAVVATATNASVDVPIIGTNRFYRVVQIQ